MPNWCNNTLEISHKDPAQLARAVQAWQDRELLSEFVPVPKDLQIVAGRAGADDTPEQIALVEAQKSNLEKYGYKDWYDWCVNEWGTKWDCGNDGDAIDPLEPDQTDITLCFDSAWGPPIGWCMKMVELGFGIRLYYYEPGMAFCGIWDNGDDDYYDIGGMSSEQVCREIPEVLDSMFGISECIAEYEDEENLEIDLDGGLSATNEQE